MTDVDENLPTRLLILRRATPEQLAQFTAEQVALLNKSDDELKKETGVFSFDTKGFEKRVETGEDWHRVIQAHLYLDHAVTTLIADTLVRPDAVRLGRMGFAQKTDLIEAMGSLPDDLLSAVRAVNGLRNRIAHQLEFSITRKDLSDLRNATPKHLRDVVHEKPSRKQVTLTDLLKVIVYMVDIFRQRSAYARATRRRNELTLRLQLMQVAPTVQRYQRKAGHQTV